MATAVPSSTSYTPGNRSRSSIVSEAASFFQSGELDSELDSVATSALNAGVSKINRHTWKKVWNKATITLAAADATYDLPADFKDPITLLQMNTSSQRDGRIPFKPHQSLVAENPYSTNSGTPFYYTIDYSARSLVLDFSPGSAFVTKHPTLVLYYHRRVPNLTQDSSTTGLPPEFDDWLVLFTAERLAIMREPEKLSYIRGSQMEAWRDLRRDDNETQTDWSVW